MADELRFWSKVLIGVEHDVTELTIRHIVHRKTWRHL